MQTLSLLRILPMFYYVLDQSIRKPDIRKFRGLLLEELEPRCFIEMLRGIPGSEAVVEKIQSKKSRRTRCQELIDFILQCESKEKDITKALVVELEKLELFHVLDAMIPKSLLDIGNTHLYYRNVARKAFHKVLFLCWENDRPLYLCLADLQIIN